MISSHAPFSLWAILLFAGCCKAYRQALIIDTDLYSDVEYVPPKQGASLPLPPDSFFVIAADRGDSDAGALLVAATLPESDLRAVNVNYASTFSALAASAILAYYGHEKTPIGIPRPLNNNTFFDTWDYNLGEYAAKVAFHWSGGSLPWGHADDAWDPVELYRKTLSEAEDGSLKIVSIGFLDNISGLLNSTADTYSPLDGPELVRRKVSELVIMGGGYPSGHSWNFWGSGHPARTSQVINDWDSTIPLTFVGDDTGKYVLAGGALMDDGPAADPVRRAYTYYTYGLTPGRASWDPLAVLYAICGLGALFRRGNDFGYNHVESGNGSNYWVWDERVTNQSFLRLAVPNETAAAEVDRLFLNGARSATGDEQLPSRETPGPLNGLDGWWTTLAVVCLCFVGLASLARYWCLTRMKAE
ncbi:hypothetical protein Daus18300_014455 [Diaporthe australafricana]|uniref:Inosine/uridine-preferring nucleoside hydrolase domain-containing protein n=1 Tax=Diaporthe australafricana TaxID=127596 RepID=A0ABR3VV48_9PEZI